MVQPVPSKPRRLFARNRLSASSRSTLFQLGLTSAPWCMRADNKMLVVKKTELMSNFIVVVVFKLLLLF